MKPKSFRYFAPSSVQEAVQALVDGEGDAKLLAGGQTLVPVMNFRLAAPSVLIDLNGIAELSGIERAADGTIRIGAMTRHRMVERSEMIREHMPLLHAAMPHIAHVQIRNRGTIGGSLAHSDPAAEWPALSLALDARMTMVGPSGTRTVGAADFALDILTTALGPEDILTAIEFPPMAKGRSWGFQEIARRRGDFALAGVAATVDFDAKHQVSAARIVAFGVANKPVLLERVAAAIVGRSLGEAVLKTAGETAAAEVEPRSDFHASAEYRRELVDVLVRRALQQAAGGPALKEAA